MATAGRGLPYPIQSTDRGGENYPYSANSQTGLISNQQKPVTTFEKFKQRVQSNRPLKACMLITSGLLLLDVLTCVAIPSGLHSYCTDYIHEVDTYRNVTVLFNATIASYCRNSLWAREVKSSLDDSIEQELELYALSCDKVQTSQEKVHLDWYDYKNLTGPFSLYGNALFTVNSNVTVNISVSIYPGHSSTVYACLFNQEKYYEKFIDERQWKNSMHYAVSCQHKKSGTYFIGLASDGMLARLDVHLYGFRNLYVRNEQDRINCTLATLSDPPCEIPLLPDGSFPCVLAYAKPPPDLRNGYTGLQLTSPAHWTWGRDLTVAVPVIVGLSAGIASVVGLLLCIWKYW